MYSGELSEILIITVNRWQMMHWARFLVNLYLVNLDLTSQIFKHCQYMSDVAAPSQDCACWPEAPRYISPD